ncbi:MAG: hypothetical protein LIP10_02130, partial [Clostridiales bacterium]|nr:hypothetical protein [Clostridiales bacterium]
RVDSGLSPVRNVRRQAHIEKVGEPEKNTGSLTFLYARGQSGYFSVYAALPRAVEQERQVVSSPVKEDEKKEGA